MPIILATQQAEIMRMAVPIPAKEFLRACLKKTQNKKGLVVWFKVKVLNSNYSSATKQNKKTSSF
jgi:hypothetical protein